MSGRRRGREGSAWSVRRGEAARTREAGGLLRVAVWVWVWVWVRAVRSGWRAHRVGRVEERDDHAEGRRAPRDGESDGISPNEALCGLPGVTSYNWTSGLSVGNSGLFCSVVD